MILKDIDKKNPSLKFHYKSRIQTEQSSRHQRTQTACIATSALLNKN